ncbi:hypothetical protein BU26DRAFT_579826 [Trematosphaeria pertusa]|uniref:Uncharacterized protein n=1 Tax=Trematosphaeria pertusa TaxID=390896 RepID=A0A6A6I414_9PLEO|nr:uncharacterized protein BU26DRAFT_579826 [Trematosphaeria pertusa]KAF2245017.1 hypothetical protein BU26DRAFT_579826 [Trematosphaeria pertusa]
MDTLRHRAAQIPLKLQQQTSHIQAQLHEHVPDSPQAARDRFLQLPRDIQLLCIVSALAIPGCLIEDPSFFAYSPRQLCVFIAKCIGAFLIARLAVTAKEAVDGKGWAIPFLPWNWGPRYRREGESIAYEEDTPAGTPSHSPTSAADDENDEAHSSAVNFPLPPTPMLPRSMRPEASTPAQHRSGIIGPSPHPGKVVRFAEEHTAASYRFKHFRGTGFGVRDGRCGIAVKEVEEGDEGENAEGEDDLDDEMVGWGVGGALE